MHVGLCYLDSHNGCRDLSLRSKRFQSSYCAKLRSFFPLPLPRHSFFFCSSPSFPDEPREETLATQATKIVKSDSNRLLWKTSLKFSKKIPKLTVISPQAQWMAKIGLDRNVCYLTYFRRICMESAEHNGAYISPTICTNRLIFGNGALFFLNMLTNRMTSQIWTFVTSLFSVHYLKISRWTPSWFFKPPLFTLITSWNH